MSGTGKYEQLLKRCAALEPVPTAVAHPCEASALAGAIEAGEQKLITPILVGPAAKIRQVATDAGTRSGPCASSTLRTVMSRRRRPSRWCAPAKRSC